MDLQPYVLSCLDRLERALAAPQVTGKVVATVMTTQLYATIARVWNDALKAAQAVAQKVMDEELAKMQALIDEARRERDAANAIAVKCQQELVALRQGRVYERPIVTDDREVRAPSMAAAE